MYSFVIRIPAGPSDSTMFGMYLELYRLLVVSPAAPYTESAWEPITAELEDPADSPS